MKNLIQTKKIIFFFGLVIALGLSFYAGRLSSSYKVVSTANASSIRVENNSSKPTLIENNNTASYQTDNSYSNTTETTQEIPKKVFEVLQYIRKNKQAPNGYVGGRTFFNRENQLLMKDELGNKIFYQEWDVNPKIEGKNRGAERLVTSKNAAYYTENHYRTFVKIPE